VPKPLRKWLGYLDQFVVFPMQVRRRLRQMSPGTLFVFSDQALGPWVPLVSGRKSVIHCHDFLALRSALGEFPQNRVSWTGRIYQRWIWRGFRKGRNFISVSERTRADLRRFLGGVGPDRSVVVHNSINYPYRPIAQAEARERFQRHGISFPEEGFILHVGGNQWYKNRDGVLAIYDAYVRLASRAVPLMMIGAPPSDSLKEAAARVNPKGAVHFVVRPPTEVLEAAYSSSCVLLFPSHAEGFGWPIIEAMAAGCPVLTTNDSPMTEVGSDVAFYLPKMSKDNGIPWAEACAQKLVDVLSRSAEERSRTREAGVAHANAFDPDSAMACYDAVYRELMGEEAPREN